jgi:hypothetical protein
MSEPSPLPPSLPDTFRAGAWKADVAKKKRSQYHAWTSKTVSWERNAYLYERI